MMYRVSEDEGATWSDPIVVYPHFAMCCAGHAVVLSSGRILLPVFKWISGDPTGEAEEFISPTLSYSFTCVSDDEGETWHVGLSELFVSVRRAAYDLEEPAAVELVHGRLLMHLRSQLGRIYRSFSEDGGISWSTPEGLAIAGAYAPSVIHRIPRTGDLLMIWNQASRQEILTGLQRHRLSCAISQDEGETWGHFKNLESLDDTTVVTPPPPDLVEVMVQWEDRGHHQPGHVERYHRAPGVLRVCYPSVAFSGDDAIVVYDYGSGILDQQGSATKLRIIPVDWFRS